jgi:WD40 repeat protein
MWGHSGEVNSIAFSSDGKRIVSGSHDMLVKIWDADTGAEVSILE